MSGGLWVYPLGWGDTLSSADWHRVYHHQLLASDFVGRACADGMAGRAALGTAAILWAESYRQDPAGTLPDNDVLLARLAGFGPDVDGWRALREMALHGWTVCEIDQGERPATAGVRLGHPVIAEVCVEMMARKRGAARARVAQREAVVRSRVRAKLIGMKLDRYAGQAAVVEGVARYLADAGLYVTDDNVRVALTDVAGVPRVVSAGGKGAAGAV